MRVPLSWLRDFVTVESDPAELAEVLSGLGLVVEGLERVGEGLDAVVVARVLDVFAIPGADKIARVVVDAGGEEVQVVCGASNFFAGDHVPLAKVGAVLPGGFEIGKRRMRGVESSGMLCSARELGLSEDHRGIMVLDSATVPGEALADALGIVRDFVFDIAVEANRPDALSIYGVARDVAAKLGLPLGDPLALAETVAGDPAAGAPGRAECAGGLAEVVLSSGETVRVEVREEDRDLCGRFTATVVTGVRVGPSPPWIARRLTMAGMRPINNVVDASNYVMLELGQPTHPYDLALLRGRSIIVRAARPGEKLKTLDGVEREMAVRSVGPGDDRRDCLICDGDDIPIGIAGIMGGQSTEILPSTTEILLEAAHFLPMAVARTSKRLGLRSEASVRFERGCDPEGIERAVTRICRLVGGHAGDGEGGRVQAHLDVSVPRELPRRITLRTERVARVLGTDLPIERSREILTAIGFRCPGDTAEPDLVVEVPSFRPDVVSEIDLIEEVARHVGYSVIARRTLRPSRAGGLSPYQRDRRRVRSVMVACGAFEAWSQAMIDPDDAVAAGCRNPLVGLENPLGAGESALRPSLLPGLLGAAAGNIARRENDVRLFELGTVFPFPDAERLQAAQAGRGRVAGSVSQPGVDAGAGTGHGEGPAATVLDEREILGAVFAVGESSMQVAIRAVVDLCDGLGLERLDIRQELEGGYSGGRAEADVVIRTAGDSSSSAAGRHSRGAGHDAVMPVAPAGRFSYDALSVSRRGALVAQSADGPAREGEVIAGVVGEVDSKVLAHFGIPDALPAVRRVAWMAVDLAILFGETRRVGTLARPLSRFPSADADLSFELPAHVTASQVAAVLRGTGAELVDQVRLIDAYRGGGSPALRSVTFRLRFSSLEGTLTDGQLAEIRAACIGAVESTLGARLRGGSQ